MKSNENNAFINKEYNIKRENEIYNLRLEIDSVNIYFKLKKLNKSIDYIYKNKFNLISFINILELNLNKYSDFDLIIKLFDQICYKDNIFISKLDDENIILKIKYLLIYSDVEKEIKLFKEYMNVNDKFNIIFNQLKFINNNNDNYEIKEIKKEINEIKIEMKKNKEEKNTNNKIDKIMNEIINKKIEEVINNFNNKFNYFKILFYFIINRY